MVQGAIVRRVTEDGPAEAAGLREGDLITAVNGNSVEGPRELIDDIANRAPGDKVTLTVRRPDEDEEDEEEEREIEVTLGEHPDEEGKAYLGVEIGGYLRLHRFGDGEGHRELELDFEWEGPLDELPRGLDGMPHHFEFHFPPFGFDALPEHFEFHSPPGPFDSDETGCCGVSI